MRPLVLDATLKAEIARVMQYACEHLIDLATLTRVARGEFIGSARNVEFTQQELDNAPTNDPGYRLVAPFGWSIVFSVEEQPSGWHRHLSVAVTGSGKVPHPVASAMLIALFGFHHGIAGCVTFIENGHAINLLEKLRDDEDPKALYLAEPWNSKPPKFS